MSISITWHGHATFTLNINDHLIVVDPFFASSNPAAKIMPEQAQAHFILQTHGHGDHIADTIPLAKHTGALVIGNVEVCNWIKRQGYTNTHGMNIGGGWQFPFGRVQMTPALHSSSLPDGTYGGYPGGFLITTDSHKIYIAGDTALFSDMALIGRGGLDVAILPIGDNFTMGPQDSLWALEWLKPKYVIPCHYNTWPLISVDVQAWAEQVQATSTATPLVLTVEKSFTFS